MEYVKYIWNVSMEEIRFMLSTVNKVVKMYCKINHLIVSRLRSQDEEGNKEQGTI